MAVSPRKRQHNLEFCDNNRKSESDSLSSVRYLLVQCILVVLVVASYHHALNGTFVFDDMVAIVRNKDVSRTPINLTNIFQNDFWGVNLQDTESHKSYRPLTTLMFHFEYAQLGLEAKHMKIVNLFFHCLNTLLVWRLLHKLDEDANDQIATIAAGLFAVHPIHTEAVCGVVGRAELLLCFLYLIALLIVKARDRLRIIADISVIVLTVIAVLVKETGITIPLACAFFDYMRQKVFLKNLNQQFKIMICKRYICYGLATLIVLIVRLWMQDFESPRFKPNDNPVAFSDDPLTRLLSQNYLYAVNFWIMLCPQWLCFDWALGCIKLVDNIWDLRLQAVLFMYSFVIVAIIHKEYNFGVLFGLGLIVIPFLPASGIIKVGFVIAERVLYVPSVGFCYLVAHSTVHMLTLASKAWYKSFIKFMLMLMIFCLILRTRQRANEWLTEDNLFKSALLVCPKNAKVHYNIARLASDKLQRDKAIEHYHKAIELYPQYEAALMNLGNLYRESGDFKLAEKYIKASLKAYPQFATAWMNLGIVQAAQKRFAESLSSYELALKYRKNYAVCHYNMGNLFLDQKMFSKAIHHWQEAVALNPRQPKAWANILALLDNQGLQEDAKRLSEQALQYLPNEVSLMFIRANVLGKLNQFVEAEALYKRVIDYSPHNVLYHTNLGVLYHRWGKLDSAIETYQRAMQISPETASTARENLSKLMKRKRKEEAKGANGSF